MVGREGATRLGYPHSVRGQRADLPVLPWAWTPAPATRELRIRERPLAGASGRAFAGVDQRARDATREPGQPRRVGVLLRFRRRGAAMDLRHDGGDGDAGALAC